MKKTYELEVFYEDGELVGIKTVVEEDFDEYDYEEAFGDERTPFINSHSTIRDRLDYEKYSNIMHRSSMKSIQEAYEEFLRCIDEF